MRAAVF